jgi:integrase
LPTSLDGGVVGGMKGAPNSAPNESTPEQIPAIDNQSTVAPKGAPSKQVHHFRVPGSSLRFTLRKRRPGRFAPWYLTSVVAGRRFHHSTASPDVKIAEEVARVKYVVPALKGDWERVAEGKLKKPFATLADLRKAWTALELGGGEAHKRQAANQLENVLRQAGVDNAAEASCAVLTAATAGRYFDTVRREADEAEGQLAAARRLRTGLSTWNQAKSVLQPNALLGYADAGMELPNVAEFLARGAMRIPAMLRVSRVQEPPPDLDLMAALVKEWPALPWNEFAGIGLALACGLRAGEWGKARWEWFGVRNGRWELNAETDVKNHSGRIEVRALNPFWAVFHERAVREGRIVPAGYVLDGTEREREEVVEVRVSDWMRGRGWTRQKTNHAFRAYAGALVVLRWGTSQARDWLRHASVTTTERHYTNAWRRAEEGRVSAVEWAEAGESR